MAALKMPVFTPGETQAPPDEDRGSARYRLHLPITTEHAETGTVSAIVRDLSNTGMLLATSAELPLGSQLLVEFPAVGTVLAEIVRRQDGLYGCEFRSHVPDSAVLETIRRSPIAWLRPENSKSTDRADSPAFDLEPIEAELPASVASARWPIAGRFAFIVGVSLLLWGSILLGIWQALA